MLASSIHPIILCSQIWPSTNFTSQFRYDRTLWCQQTRLTFPTLTSLWCEGNCWVLLQRACKLHLTTRCTDEVWYTGLLRKVNVKTRTVLLNRSSIGSFSVCLGHSLSLPVCLSVSLCPSVCLSHSLSQLWHYNGDRDLCIYSNTLSLSSSPLTHIYLLGKMNKYTVNYHDSL